MENAGNFDPDREYLNKGKLACTTGSLQHMLRIAEVKPLIRRRSRFPVFLSLNGSTDKYGHYSSPFANRSSDSYICSRKNSVRFLNSQDVNKGNCRVEFLKSAEYDPRYTKNQQGQTQKKWPLSLFAHFLH